MPRRSAARVAALASRNAEEVVVARVAPDDAIIDFLLFLKKDNLVFFQKKERCAARRQSDGPAMLSLRAVTLTAEVCSHRRKLQLARAFNSTASQEGTQDDCSMIELTG